MVEKFFIKKSNWLTGECEPGLVSVIIPTFNREQLLDEALLSIRRQHYRPLEVIVVDDGSTDNTANLVQQWKRDCQAEHGFSLKYIWQANQGAPAARNRGMLSSSGCYLQFLDSDDILLPDKISDAMAAFEAEPELDMVFCLRGELSSTLDDIIAWARVHADLEKDLSPAEVVLTNVWTALPLFARNVLRKAGPWNEQLASLQDWEYIGCVSYWAQRARRVGKIQALCREHVGSRLSINPWGNAVGVQANAKASLALYPFVLACNSPRRQAALTALARRSLSCVRVAAGAGHTTLAREILVANHEVLTSHNRILLESWLWRILLYLPDAMTLALFIPLRVLKQRRSCWRVSGHADGTGKQRQ